MVHRISVSSTHSSKGGKVEFWAYEGGVCAGGVTRCVR